MNAIPVGSNDFRPARTGRIQEFGLLVVACVIIALGWFLVDYAFAPNPAEYTVPA